MDAKHWIAAVGVLSLLLLAQVWRLEPAWFEPVRDAITAIPGELKGPIASGVSRAKPTSTAGGKRVALVIGNEAYDGKSWSRLASGEEDAAAVARILRDELGFTVIEETNLKRREMLAAIDAFEDALDKDATALLYYSGHGMALGADNYLIPVDAPDGSSERILREESVKLDDFLAVFKAKSTGLNVVVLDACRSDPYANRFGTSAGGGRFSAGHGGFRVKGVERADLTHLSGETLIAFAAAPQETARAGGDGELSPYTAALVAELAKPQHLWKLFGAVKQRVESNPDTDQRPWSENNLGDERVLAASLASALEPEMVRVGGGCFLMGSPEDEVGRDDFEDQQRVCVDDFWIGAYEVTVGEFRRFVDATGYLSSIETFDPSLRSGSGGNCFVIGSDGRASGSTSRSWRAPIVPQRTLDEHPVSCLTVDDMAAYMVWLSQQTGERYRFPTHAEWEFAARGGREAAGRTDARFWGNNPDRACDYANVLDQGVRPDDREVDPYRHGCNDRHPFVAPVGRFRPNALGLYDMLGNVREVAAVSLSAVDDTPCPNFDTNCNWYAHGGSFIGGPAEVRAAARAADFEPLAWEGFRLVREVE